jgi:hypothetical protein
VICEILLRGGNSYYTAEFHDVAALRAAIASGASVECWWYLNNGRAYVEQFVFADDEVQLVRTDSNAIKPTPDVMMGRFA